MLFSIIIKLCRYPGCLFTVPPDDVEVCQQVEGDLNKELEAEQSQDAEVNIGQLDREGLVGEFLRRLRCRHFPFLAHCDTGSSGQDEVQDQIPVPKRTGVGIRCVSGRAGGLLC